MRAASKSRGVSKILIRPALWFCACNLLAATLAAQCTNPTQVPNGTYTSGDHSATDNNALAASSFAVSGGATATFAAGNCIHLAPGFRANAVGASVPTTFHAWVETAPAAVSVAPPSSSGLSQAFTWTVSSPSGYGNISDVYALFNTSISGANACYIHYNRASNLLSVADNSGANWSTGIVPGSSGTTGTFSPNCTVNGTGSSVNPSGTQLALTTSVTFQSTFSGAKNRYLIAYDNAGLNTTWQQFGTWTASNPGGFTPIRISSGGAYTDTLGQAWSADYGYLQGSTYSTSATITGTSDQQLYRTERWNQPSLTYQFSVPNGNYTVTLKFAEIYDTAAGQRYQNIALNGTTVVTGLDVWTATGGPNRAYDLSYPVSVTNGVLTITLTCTSSNNSAEVNAIQIVAGSAPQQYYLSTAVSPSGAGTISPSCPGGCLYNSGTPVTITATPASGYHFTGFTGTVNSGSNPLTVTMNSSMTETANFAQNVTYYPLTTTVSPSAGGTVSPSCPGGCSYGGGSQVTITATPASGYQFNGFTGSVNSGSNPLTVTLNSAMTETATFTAIATQYQLTTNVNPAGTGSISPATGAYNAGAMTITATANTGYAFSNFTGTYSGTTNPLSINLNGNGTITANFVPGYTVSGQVTLSGSGTGVSGVNVSASGSQSGSTITDANGRYSLPGLAGGGSYTVAAAKGGYILSAAQNFTNLSSNQTASFTATPTLSINGGSNTAEVAPSTTVSMAFNLYDQAGANDISWAQFYLSDSSGGAHCYGDWGRPNGLDLYDGDTGATWGFGTTQTDSFCTVLLASITNSPTDATAVTVVLNLTFNPGTDGTYSVLTQINYGSGSAGSWQALGTLTIDPAITPVTSPPTNDGPAEVEAIPTPPTAVSQSGTDCNDVSGVWAGPSGSGSTYSINTSGGVLSSGSAWTYCGVTTPMTGFRQVDGTWQINIATDVYACGYDFPPITAIMSPSCTSATITAGGGTTTTTTSTPSDRLTAFATTAASPSTTWTRSGPPGITVTLDLMAGTISTQLTGQNKTSDLKIVVNNSQNQQMLPLSHAFARAGNSFTDRFRTQLPAGQQYGSVVATWDSGSVTVPVTFFTIGYTHFTQYNTPYHSKCSANQQAAAIITMDAKYCYYKTLMLGTGFLTAAGSGRNGTGVYDANGTNTVLKAYSAGATQVCPLTKGFDSAHTFFAVDAGGNTITTVTGAALNTLSDGTGAASSVNANNPRPGSLAVDPCAANAPAWAQTGCTTIVSPPVYLFSRSRKGSSDPILLFDQNDTNDARDLRLVQDLCPACKNQATQQSSTAAHIDMYNGTSQSCSAGVVGDYGYYYAIRLR